uniref:Uncharacterized protein n=1 Tax=Rhizophora mucronata TaxID=61149 RepID=A0A2P2IJZ0_RHIMU
MMGLPRDSWQLSSIL